MKTLCVEGWRFIPHSYAMINQWQLLSFLKRMDIALSVRDVPFYRSGWQPVRGLFEPEQEKALIKIPTLGPDVFPDATFRISFPYDFSQCAKGHTVVFATCEFQLVREDMFAAPIDLEALTNSDSFVVLTPSRWSAEGFRRLGLRNDQIMVVPLGVSTEVFNRSIDARRSIRERLGLSGFTFAHASAMTSNKGIDILLRAFAAVVERHHEVRLLLKGSDGLYGSVDLLKEAISNLPRKTQCLLGDRLLYFGAPLSARQMAEFYLAADAYLSPYRAEGFNLPALEASACGIPVICTRGGSTDDFMDGTFALFIESAMIGPTERGVYLEPNLDHLICLMLCIMEDDTWRNTASVAAAKHAVKFGWDAMAQRLIDGIFKASP